jgi:hypothetical protein
MEFFCECGVQSQIRLRRNSLPLHLATLRAIQNIRTIDARKLLFDAIQSGTQPMLGKVFPVQCRA